MKRVQIAQFAGIMLLVLLIGLSSGYSLGYFQAKRTSMPEIRIIDDINPRISTIKFLKVSANTLSGQIDGNPVRIAHSPDGIIDLEPGESFSIPLSQVSLASYYTAMELPEGALYIASSQGKYFYHIFDPRALKITPKNRLYFKEESQAKGAGYLSAD